MTRTASALVLSFVALAWASSAQAATIINFGGASDPSLHGATGSLTFEDYMGDTKVTWTINTMGFDDAGATSTGHTLLTDVAFKVEGITNAELMNMAVGTLYYPTNINSSTDGCDTGGSPAGFVCVKLASPINATTDQIFSVVFIVEGTLNLDAEISYRGKFGPETGWVISEDTGPMIPEPSAAVVYGFGLLAVGARRRRPRR